MTIVGWQVDICKRVLNIYRFMVMNEELQQDTWWVNSHILHDYKTRLIVTCRGKMSHLSTNFVMIYDSKLSVTKWSLIKVLNVLMTMV